MLVYRRVHPLWIDILAPQTSSQFRLVRLHTSSITGVERCCNKDPKPFQKGYPSLISFDICNLWLLLKYLSLDSFWLGGPCGTGDIHSTLYQQMLEWEGGETMRWVMLVKLVNIDGWGCDPVKRIVQVDLEKSFQHVQTHGSLNCPYLEDQTSNTSMVVLRGFPSTVHGLGW